MIKKDAFILPACSDMQHFGQVKAYNRINHKLQKFGCGYMPPLKRKKQHG